MPAATTDEREHRDLAATTQLLHDRLGELRRPRPGFQSDLEARLVARLPEASRPWWRRTLAPAAFRPDPARRNGRAGRITRRRALAGLAAGLAGVALAGGLALPLARPTEASAAEIIEKSQEFAADPLLSGIKSFHLKAKTTGRPFQPGKAVTSTTEQWFVAPDKMRMESRTEVDGKTAVSGSAHVGGELIAYTTPGADQHDRVGVMPIAFPATRVDGPPVEGAQVKVSVFRKKGDGGSPSDGASVGVIIRRPGPDGSRTDEDVRVIRRAGPDGAPPAEGASDVIVVDNCPPPTRKGGNYPRTGRVGAGMA